ncbi:hypothetical protein VNI00_001355 [Paramarasmius palmivorus]|uniref:Uncharacterized protein n=1 Tax=Paramarasmius palmivorus TaxID=297713 RepID=A0AAW0E8V1_9AGAR
MPRPQHAAHPPISYPRASDSSISLSSSTLTSRPRKHSLTLTNPMGWLSRTNTSQSSSSAKLHRKSDSKSPRSIELVSERTGPLGSGATVVRTPEEALQDTRVCLTRYDSRSVDEMGQKARPIQPPISPVSDNACLPLTSTPLPSLPGSDGEEEDSDDHFDFDNDESLRPIGTSSPPRPTRDCPPVPNEVSPRSSLKSTTPRSSSEDVSQIPPLPMNVTASCPPQPEFRPILVSDVPSGPVDFSKVLITLETCTTTYRTTMETLTSRPSHLSAYVISLFPRQRSNSTTSSVYSTNSSDLSLYRNHLASQGLLSQSASNLHIFLDRPSAPYAHILNYLRSPDSEECGLPESLPRAVQLQPSYTQSRLEALLELRDEAAYLNLEGLYKLCIDELRLRQPSLTPRIHSRNQSRTLQSATNPGRISVQSQHASVHSFPLEASISEPLRSATAPRLRRKGTSNADSTSSAEGHVPATMRMRSPPTPTSWRDARSSTTSSSRSRSRTGPLQSPPAGWI